MANRMTPEDADLIAQRVVARIARLIVAIALTLLALWILPVLFAFSFRAGPSDGFPWAAILMGLVAVVVVVAVVRFWSKALRGTSP